MLLPDGGQAELESACIGSVRETLGCRTRAEVGLKSQGRHAGYRTVYVLARVDRCKVWVIEQVERVEGEHRLYALGEGERFRDTGVEPRDAVDRQTTNRTEGHTASQSAAGITIERAGERRGERRGSGSRSDLHGRSHVRRRRDRAQ